MLYEINIYCSKWQSIGWIDPGRKPNRKMTRQKRHHHHQHHHHGRSHPSLSWLVLSQSHCSTPWSNKHNYDNNWCGLYNELLLQSCFGKLVDKSTHSNTCLSTNANNYQQCINNLFKTSTNSKKNTEQKIN